MAENVEEIETKEQEETEEKEEKVEKEEKEEKEEQKSQNEGKWKNCEEKDEKDDKDMDEGKMEGSFEVKESLRNTAAKEVAPSASREVRISVETVQERHSATKIVNRKAFQVGPS